MAKAEHSDHLNQRDQRTVGWKAKIKYHRTIEWTKESLIITIKRTDNLADHFMPHVLRGIADELETYLEEYFEKKYAKPDDQEEK